MLPDLRVCSFFWVAPDIHRDRRQKEPKKRPLFLNRIRAKKDSSTLWLWGNAIWPRSACGLIELRITIEGVFSVSTPSIRDGLLAHGNLEQVEKTCAEWVWRPLFLVYVRIPVFFGYRSFIFFFVKHVFVVMAKEAGPISFKSVRVGIFHKFVMKKNVLLIFYII